MKKMKLFATLALIIVISLSLTISSFAGGGMWDGGTYVTLGKAPQLSKMIYNGSIYGPISITSGTLYKNGTYSNIFLICLIGTTIKSGQATGIITAIQSGFSQSNAYVEAVKAAISKRNIPAGSNLVLAGRSLGGMVAQQVAADSTIKSKYNVLNTITFSSPLITFISREGTVQRLGDTNDIVPTLTVANLFSITAVWNAFGLNRENGGYGTNLLGAHIESCNRSDVWGSYDVLGFKYGSAYINYNAATRVFYPAPAWVK